eukprot:CAMPEP_0173374228 /NCGR_PEP_ID=MMETSP1144-20121109/28968_1 /TAXON_ID=483371 /ORGANISM="non described non described, Strain CCMP2298" /LENGTH=817 /DNA_ID=CAMNT_0014326553 /DNA_START=130 /DNA_END=2582 /DNA_ORIENTATION=+
MSPPSPLTLKRIEDGGIEMNPVTQGSPYVKISRKLSIVSEQGEGSVVPAKAWVQTFVAKNRILMVLCVVGVLTGVINGLAIWLVTVGSKAQARLLLLPSGHGVAWFIITTAGMCALSALITKTGGLAATFGSGMPEVKTLLVNDFLPHEYPLLVSPKILLLRLLSNISAVLSGLGIGMAGPLVHVSVSTAYCVVHYIPFFRKLEENPAVMKQIFAAAATVGLSTVFNAPVGGLLFSVEVTSTYYLISNYWRSFMASTIGAVMFDIVLKGRQGSYRLYQVPTFLNPYESWEFIMFFLIGIVTGVMAYLYLQMHQRWFLFVKPHVTKHPIFTAALGGAVSALLIWAVGAYSMKGVTGGVIVSNLFKSASISDMQTSYSDVSPIGGLFASFFVRWFLTLLGTTLRISAGIFVPMLTLGALIGRIFGQVVLIREAYVTKHPIFTAALGGAVSALLIWAVGAYSMKGVTGGVIVSNLFKSASISDMQTSYSDVSPIGGLFASFFVRWFLTLLGTTLRISAGIFVPMLTLGALIGRIFGQVVLIREAYVTKHPIFTAALGGAVSALLIWAVGAYSMKGVTGGVIVSNLFKSASISDMQTSYSDVSPIGGLFASFFVRWFLTLLGTTLRISAGIFVPMLTLGALIGRIFGQVVLIREAYVTKHPIFTAALGGAVSALLIWAVGAYSMKGVTGGVIVSNLFKSASISDMQTSYSDVSPIGGLFASFFVRWFLTLLGTTLRISAGIFVPMLTLGALIGRIFGQVVLIREASRDQAPDLHCCLGGCGECAADTTMDQLYVLFEMVHVSCVFVVDEGKSLQGIISKKA